MRRVKPLAATLALTGLCLDTRAHGGTEPTAAFAGLIDPTVILVPWVLYEVGHRRLGGRPWRALCFRLAMGIAAVATLGPLDLAAERSTAMHMIQHMLLMTVVAPLAALGRPLPVWSALVGRILRRAASSLSMTVRHPLALALLHGIVIWVWHAPAAYRLALEHPGWHLAEHAGFVISGALFWWSALHAAAQRIGPALIALLLTLMHTGLLGALLTFARAPLYGPAFSLEDQQLAGLIMWVPAGLAYLGAAAWLSWHALAHDRQDRLTEVEA